MNEKFFYLFLDFVIKLIDEDKIGVEGCSQLTHFRIVLVDNEDVLKRIEVRIYYQSNGTFIGVVDPIERFKIEVVQGIMAVLSTSSKNAESYDKLLELFKSAINYMKRHNNNYNNLTLNDSLERKNWEKSISEIEKETDENLDIRLAEEGLQRTREVALNKLILKYRHQGYKIE